MPISSRLFPTFSSINFSVSGLIWRSLIHLDLSFVQGGMGGLTSILSMLPGMGIKGADLESMIDEKQLKRMEAIVLSMTKEERRNPKLLNPQRKHRIARGAGVDIAIVNRFIKQFEQSQKMMKQFGGGKKGRGMFGGFPGMGKGRFPF